MFRIGQSSIEVYEPRWKGECWACRDENADESQYAPNLDNNEPRVLLWYNKRNVCNCM